MFLALKLLALCSQCLVGSQSLVQLRFKLMLKLMREGKIALETLVIAKKTSYVDGESYAHI